METIGLAVALELPLLILDIQRAGPSTGMPTKPEQADLLLAMWGRNAESPVPVVAASTPGGCFETAIEAARIALPGSRKIISPKSDGQRVYLEAISSHDIVVSIGPAIDSRDKAPEVINAEVKRWIDTEEAAIRRINAGLNGCGERATGPELLTVMVEDFTGRGVDNYVKLDFDGFTELIDTVGGVRVCREHRTREPGLFELPAGCSRLDGETYLKNALSLDFGNALTSGRPVIEDIARVFPDGGSVSADDLVAKGLVRKGKLVKVLGNGEVGDVKLDVTADAFSGSARSKLEAAGGSATTN
jgi:hypothetical protein